MTLEFILWFPVLVITLLAVVEFSLILAGAKPIAFASRTGAKLAAENPNLGSGSTAQTAVNPGGSIYTAVNNELQSAGFGTNAAAGIRLEYNLSNGSSGDVSSGTCPQLSAPAVTTNWVRVTVCVNLSTVTPNMLATYGFSTTGRTIVLSTTRSYEF